MSSEKITEHNLNYRCDSEGGLVSIDPPHSFLMCGECGCAVFTPVVNTALGQGMKSPIVGLICANKPCRNVLLMTGDVAQAATPKMIDGETVQ